MTTLAVILLLIATGVIASVATLAFLIFLIISAIGETFNVR